MVDPNNAEAYNQIGYYYGYRGEYDKAMDNLKKYQFISPDNANPFDSLGENQAYSGRYNEAIENLNRALAIKADFAPAYDHLGVAYEGMGDYEKAVQSYRKAAELADSDGMRREYLFGAMRAALIGRRPRGSPADRRRDLQDPGGPQGRLRPRRSRVHGGAMDLAEGRAAEAERRLKEMKPEARRALGRERARPASFPRARKAHYPQWNYMMARALEVQGQTDEALKFYEANANPPNPILDFGDRRWIMEGRAKVAADPGPARGPRQGREAHRREPQVESELGARAGRRRATVAELRRAKVLAATK